MTDGDFDWGYVTDEQAVLRLDDQDLFCIVYKGVTTSLPEHYTEEQARSRFELWLIEEHERENAAREAGLKADLVRKYLYRVVAYRVTREYGGPEEGGWWFDERTAEAVALFRTEADADAKANEWADGEYAYTGKRGSVLGGADYSVYTYAPGEVAEFFESDYRPYE